MVVAFDPSYIPLEDFCFDNWRWDVKDRSRDTVTLPGNRVLFHPTWSNGTAGIRGNKPLTHGAHYWEIRFHKRVFGTSMMVGVATKQARLHTDIFTNLMGQDSESWGMSHKGLIWHDGNSKRYTEEFQEQVSTTVGVLYDRTQGTLTYFKDGKNLGIAFTGLRKVKEDLYPFITSTAAKTEMSTECSLRSFDNLQDRCRAVIALYCTNNDIDMLPIPKSMKEYIDEIL